MKTFMANAQNIKKEWLVVDVADMPAGRAASQVASILRGKHKPTFTPHADAGDYVIVLNTDKLIFTGKKLENKLVRHHTGYVGGLKEVQLKKLMSEKSDRVFYNAVKGIDNARYKEKGKACHTVLHTGGQTYFKYHIKLLLVNFKGRKLKIKKELVFDYKPDA